MRAAAAIQDREMMLLLAETLASCADGLDQASLNTVIDEVIKLGDRMRGTDKGNGISDQLFAMVRKCGERVDVTTVDRLVLRGDTYSRTGLALLAILYDDYFQRISSLEMVYSLAIVRNVSGGENLQGLESRIKRYLPSARDSSKS